MSDHIRIHNTDIVPLDVNGIRVITLEQMDDIHERPSGTARRTFNKHQQRLTEGKHYFVRNTYEASKLGITAPNGLVLLTEPGYLMLVKAYRDKLAWEVQEKLVEYFRSPRHQFNPVDHFPELKAIIELVQSTAEARMLAEQAAAEAKQAQDRANEAHDNANRALYAQQFFTVAEYIYFEQLERKVPKRLFGTLSEFLRNYCHERGIPFRRQAVGGKTWDSEYSFHSAVFTEALPGWLMRLHSQIPLIDPDTEET